MMSPILPCYQEKKFCVDYQIKIKSWSSKAAQYLFYLDGYKFDHAPRSNSYEMPGYVSRIVAFRSEIVGNLVFKYRSFKIIKLIVDHFFFLPLVAFHNLSQLYALDREFHSLKIHHIYRGVMEGERDAELLPPLQEAVMIEKKIRVLSCRHALNLSSHIAMIGCLAYSIFSMVIGMQLIQTATWALCAATIYVVTASIIAQAFPEPAHRMPTLLIPI